MCLAPRSNAVYVWTNAISVGPRAAVCNARDRNVPFFESRASSRARVLSHAGIP
ncbi:hypothetical protein C7S13_5887 [Burkholderia cepacia]|nr:hypothetical protein [Burkholderia cepacia]